MFKEITCVAVVYHLDSECDAYQNRSMVAWLTKNTAANLGRLKCSQTR